MDKPGNGEESLFFYLNYICGMIAKDHEKSEGNDEVGISDLCDRSADSGLFIHLSNC